MAAGGHYGCPKINFNRISSHFRSIQNFFYIFFYKMAAKSHFGCPKFNFNRISGHFRSICNFNFFKFLTKWPAADILDVRKSLSIAFLTISDRSAILDVWNSLSIAILVISYQCRIFFPAAILDVRKSLLIVFLAILDPYGTFFVFNFWENGRRQPFWMGRQCQLSNSSEIFGCVMHVSRLKNVV